MAREACQVDSPRPSRTWDDCAREIGIRLQRARHSRGMSQEAVAHAAGIAGQTYYKYEKGESKPGTPLNPRLRTLLAVTQVLGIELTTLLPEDLPDLTAGR